jgi:hypothetical protein
VRQGATTYTQFQIRYGLCTNQSAASCTPDNYSATGYSFQTLSPPYTNLYNVSITSQYGVVVINGQSYLGSTVVYLTSGTYTLYAQPNAGHSFSGWDGTTCPLSPATQNAILVLSSNCNIVAVFT